MARAIEYKDRLGMALEDWGDTDVFGSITAAGKDSQDTIGRVTAIVPPGRY